MLRQTIPLNFIPTIPLRRSHPFSINVSTFTTRSLHRPKRFQSPIACLSPTPLRNTTRIITTPLFYVNASPHMGSAYPTIAADALSRFYQMAGANPIFVTGCDEHGEKIAAAALNSSSNSDIQSFCDQIALQFKDLWQLLDIQYHKFIRTTNVDHAKIVTEFMNRVWDNGDIYKSSYKGLYCTGCEEYKDEKDLIDKKICPTHQKECSSREEENYFFALSKYQDRLQSFLTENEQFVVPAERRNEVLGWVKSGLRDFSVSRANNPWGIPVPKDDSQTIYVWFDALLGYISALLSNEDQPTLENALRKGWPADVHIIGKDILRFHAVYWPAMLMSAGLPLPKRVVGHGFITKDGMKMGKSLGNTLDPKQLVQDYGSDAVRYYFLRGVDFGRDGDFSTQRFIDIVNADLANSLGNLLNRSLNLLKKNCNGQLPFSAMEIGVEDEEEAILRKCVEENMVQAYQLYEKLDFVGACDAIMKVSYEANAYIDRVAPWTKFKSQNEEDVIEAQRCIVNILEASRIVAAALSPIIPNVSERIYKALGLSNEFENGLDWDQEINWGKLSKGMVFAKPKPVFPRLEVTLPQEVGVA